jgi:hypothetical protein
MSQAGPGRVEQHAARPGKCASLAILVQARRHRLDTLHPRHDELLPLWSNDPVVVGLAADYGVRGFRAVMRYW